MEILIRLFLWILNRTFGRQNAASLYGSNPMDEKLLLDLEESRQLEREAQLQTQIVENFKSTASAVHGAVDYGEMKWDSFVKVVETPEQFLFCGERSVQKIIAKSAFTDRREIVTLRRVIRRRVSVCELRDD
jgi:hypothetical protein